MSLLTSALFRLLVLGLVVVLDASSATVSVPSVACSVIG